MNFFISFLSGLLFSTGLAISGMMNPDKVKNFLDLTGHWDPSLALVMGGALAVGFVVFRFPNKKMQKPICESGFCLPTKTNIDTKLIIGAILFGAGWAIAGMCPGPALSNAAALTPTVGVFLLSMISGLAIVKWLEK